MDYGATDGFVVQGGRLALLRLSAKLSHLNWLNLIADQSWERFDSTRLQQA